MVADCTALNEKTVRDAYLLPNINDIFDQLGNANFCTVLDLASGSHEIPTDPADRHETAFSTPYSHYEFLRIPFSLKGDPNTF